MKNALLLTAPFPSKYDGMPSGLLQIGTVLNDLGINTKIFDLSSRSQNIHQDDWKFLVSSVLTEFSNEKLFVGITLTSPAVSQGIELANFIKKIHPNSFIATGGAHFDKPKYFLEDPRTSSFDFVYHQRNLTLKNFAEVVFSERFEDIPNSSIRLGNNIKYTREEKVNYEFSNRIPKYELLKEPEIYTYSGIHEKKRAHKKYLFAQAFSSLGCNHNCVFCRNGNDPYFNILAFEEIAFVLSAMKGIGIEFIFFDDPTFTQDKSRLKEICKIIKSKDFAWACQTRIDQVDASILNMMKEAGCEYIFYGVESGDESVKKYLRKNISNQKIIETILETVNQNIIPGISLIFGVPNETITQRQNTYNLLKEINDRIRKDQAITPMISPSFFAVYHGTEAEIEVNKRGINLDYIGGYNHEEIWTKFDDGYGAFHLFDHKYAEEVYNEIYSVVYNECKQLIFS